MVYTSNITIPKFWFSKRFFVAVLMFLVTLHIIGIMINLNIAIVVMTSNQTIIMNGETITQEPEFHWNLKTNSFLLGVFSYGFLVLPFCSSITIKYGGSKTIGVALMAVSIMTILSPLIIRLNFYLYVAMRIVEGSFEGLIYASFPELWAQWGPNQDRSKLMSIGYWGGHVGGFMVFPICGYSIHQFGWPAAFYVTGGSTFICSLLWLYFVPNTPASDKWISKEEMTYIMENKNQNQRPKHIASTWKHIVTSKCVWALGFCKFTFALGTTFIRACLPMYIKDITNDEIDEIGVLSGLPQILCAFAFPATGFILDYLQNNQNLTITQTHKLFMGSAYAIGATLLISIALFRFDFTINMIFFTITNLMDTFCSLIVQIGSICVAPQCAGLVATVMELFYSAGYLAGPMLIGLLITDHNPEEWNHYILLVGIVSLFSAVFYIAFGSSEAQPWSYSTQEDNPKNDSA